MKKIILSVVSFYFVLLGCKEIKNDNKLMPINEIIEKNDTDNTTKDSIKRIITSQEKTFISSQTNTNQTTADTLRIYEEHEVQRALFPLSNSQFTEFYTKNFKYPPITPVNGKGTVDLVIERNGKVSDVIIVKGIHPEIDKEFVRVLKMMPNFTPGKKDGIPIRSKYRMPITSIYR